MFDLGSVDLNISISNGGYPSNFFEELINSMIDRIVNDVYAGSGAPSAVLGEDGDLYLDLSGLDFYSKTSGVWDAGTALGNTDSDTVLLINGRT